MLLPTEPLELVLEQRIDGHSLSLTLDLLALAFSNLEQKIFKITTFLQGKK